jgi:ABC-type glycerol-3-phosphate transport system permease component
MVALVLPFGASALGTFLVRQACLSIPDELIEAARLDGASDLHIVYSLLAPCAQADAGGTILLSFVFHWNDYFWPLVMTTDDRIRTVPVGMPTARAGERRALASRHGRQRDHERAHLRRVCNGPAHLVRAVATRGF